MTTPHYGTTLRLNDADVSEVIDLTAPGFEREAVDTHTLTSTFKTARASHLVMASDCEFTVQHDKTTHANLLNVADSGTVQNWQVGFYEGGVASGLLYSFPGFVKSFSPESVSKDDADNYTATFVVHLTAKPTRA